MAQSNVCEAGSAKNEGEKSERTNDLVELAGGNDEDVDGGQVLVAAKAELRDAAQRAVRNDVPDRLGAYKTVLRQLPLSHTQRN